MYQNKIKEVDALQQEINEYRPLRDNEAKELRDYFRIGLTYSSNALEGNSLTETETKIVLEDGLTIGGKTLREHFEAIGHAQAFDHLFSLVADKVIREEDILHLHKLFYYHIDPREAGAYRDKQVLIPGTDFVPPAPNKVSFIMREFAATLPELAANHHPVEYAALAHKELVTIHPFVDGNGRTARLVMNLALLQHGYVITTIPPVLRNDYIDALKKSQVEPRDDTVFVNFISCMVYECQKDYLRMLRALREDGD